MGQISRVFVALLLALALGACPADEDPEPDVQPGQEEPEEPEDIEETPEEVPEEAEEALEPDGDADEDGRWLIDFESPYTYEADGVSFEIDGIGFVSRERLLEEAPDAEDLVDEDTQTFVTLRMSVENESGQDVNFFPDQGELVLGDEQLDADLWFSDSVGGGPMREGVRSEGTVVWESRQAFDEVVALGSLRFTALSPFAEDDWESLGDEVDITIEWEPR